MNYITTELKRNAYGTKLAHLYEGARKSKIFLMLTPPYSKQRIFFLFLIIVDGLLKGSFTLQVLGMAMHLCSECRNHHFWEDRAGDKAVPPKCSVHADDTLDELNISKFKCVHHFDYERKLC